MRKLIIANFISMLMFSIGMFIAFFFNLIYHETEYETAFNQVGYHISNGGTVMMLVGAAGMIVLSIVLFIKRKVI